MDCNISSQRITLLWNELLGNVDHLEIHKTSQCPRGSVEHLDCRVKRYSQRVETTLKSSRALRLLGCLLSALTKTRNTSKSSSSTRTKSVSNHRKEEDWREYISPNAIKHADWIENFATISHIFFHLTKYSLFVDSLHFLLHFMNLRVILQDTPHITTFKGLPISPSVPSKLLIVLFSALQSHSINSPPLRSSSVVKYSRISFQSHPSAYLSMPSSLSLFWSPSIASHPASHTPSILTCAQIPSTSRATQFGNLFRTELLQSYFGRLPNSCVL